MRGSSLIAAQPGGPVADAPDRIVAETLRARVLPADDASDLHFGTRDELFAGQRVREVALVETLYDARPVHDHLNLFRGAGGYMGRVWEDVMHWLVVFAICYIPASWICPLCACLHRRSSRNRAATAGRCARSRRPSAFVCHC